MSEEEVRWAFVYDSEPFIVLAIWIGIFCILLCLLLTIYALILRMFFVFRERRAVQFRQQWEGLIAESLDQLPQNLPRISARDEFNFLMLWNHLQESLRAESKEKLNRLARETDIDVVATRRLERGSLDERLLAINTLGWLRDDTNWKQLLAIAEDDDPVYSLSAAKALMRIDAKRALPKLLPLIARREDWSITTVAGFLREAGADTISEPLAKAVLNVTHEQAPRLIRFLELGHLQIVVPSVRTLISNSSDTAIIVACLQVLQDADDLATVRKFLEDDRSQIRLEAVNCLGRIGTEEDEIRLINATADEDWNVRYHASQALANLPSMNLERLNKIAETHSNQQARGVIRQVIAEKQIVEI